MGHKGSKEINDAGYVKRHLWEHQRLAGGINHALLSHPAREHIPQTWKKWAVLLAKTTDTTDINNLRPIGLEDCMRKLWFSIPGTLAKGLAGAHFGEKNKMKLKNETVG